MTEVPQSEIKNSHQRTMKVVACLMIRLHRMPSEEENSNSRYVWNGAENAEVNQGNAYKWTLMKNSRVRGVAVLSG